MDLIVYDFDRTLITKNSTIDFVEFVLKSKRPPILRFIYRILNLDRLLCSAHIRLKNIDRSTYYVSKLSGIALYEYKSFVNSYIKCIKWNDQVFQQFSLDIRNSECVLVASGGLLDIVCEFLKSHHIAIPVIASELESVDGTLTGMYSFRIYANKLFHIRKRFDEPLTLRKIVSDNIEDAIDASCFNEFTKVKNGKIIQA